MNKNNIYYDTNEWCIGLKSGMFALINEKCISFIQQYKWGLSDSIKSEKKLYLKTERVISGKRKKLYLQRELYQYFIGDIPNKKSVEFKDRNTFNYKLCNLYIQEDKKAFFENGEWHLPLTHGFKTLIDKQCISFVEKINWHVTTPRNKIQTRYVKGNINGRTVSLHRQLYETFVKPIPEEMQIDHIDNNALNNKLSNLRLVTHSQNGKNRRSATNKSSKYLGVYWHKKEEKWHAQISPDRKKVHLGYFKDEIEAALAYDVAALKYYGQYANTNF